MGRKPLPSSESSKVLILKLPPDKWEIKDELITIAKREGKQLQDIYVQFLEEGIAKHGSKDPNSQQLIQDFTNGSPKTTAYLKTQVMKKFADKKDVYYKEILKEVRNAGVNSSRIVDTCESVARDLRKQGGKVWRR